WSPRARLRDQRRQWQRRISAYVLLRRTIMAFMEPVYSNAQFVTVTHANGESYSIPAEYREPLDDGDTVEITDGKWWCRLSADGYTDQTDWSGPFDTEQEARDHIEDFYEVDPDTGDELDEA